MGPARCRRILWLNQFYGPTIYHTAFHNPSLRGQISKSGLYRRCFVLLILCRQHNKVASQYLDKFRIVFPFRLLIEPKGLLVIGLSFSVYVALTVSVTKHEGCSCNLNIAGGEEFLFDNQRPREEICGLVVVTSVRYQVSKLIKRSCKMQVHPPKIRLGNTQRALKG